MSNSLAIAAVTATLRKLLFDWVSVAPDLADTSVTTHPPGGARDPNDNANQINLFLYQTVPNAAWRNMDMPRQIKPGETGQPPLALNLYYFLTAYGRNNDEVFSHRLLGQAMSILHDHPLLGAEEIEAALAGNDLHQQVERVRITPQPLSIDDMSKLWTMFQTEYRISAAYEVAVVLIESRRPARTPLPVLTRGPGDEGVPAQPDLTPPFPTLESVHPPQRQPSIRLGEKLILNGHHLDGDELVVLFSHPRLEDPNQVPPLPGGTATEVQVEIPDVPTDWPAGTYTAAIGFMEGAELVRTTNQLPFGLAPSIVDTTLNPPPPDSECDQILTVECSPLVRPAQSAALLLGDRGFRAQPHPISTNELDFCLKDVPAGEYFVRLRIDGVDSLLVDRSVTPPVFDETQKVTMP
jgi:hypothetical protein